MTPASPHMESYLKGRKTTQVYRAKLPPPKKNAEQAQEEEVIAAEPMPDAGPAPAVDLVMREGVVQRIIVHLPGGQRLELECEYDGEV